MDHFRKLLSSKKARLEIICVVTDPEICHQRMIRRNSSRDTWKLENWDQYISGVDFSIPSAIDRPDSSEDDLLLFYNSTDQEYQESMKRIVGILEEDC